jgi:ABC-type nitrate/sulfonate/bicarbonate transport system permease component
MEAPSAAAPETAPMPFRGEGFNARRTPLAAPFAWALIIAAWWIAASAGLVDPVALPHPRDVLSALTGLAASGELARHSVASLQRLLVGWTLGATAGVVVGLMIGLAPLARATALPLISALFAVPKIALLPLFIVWLGIGELSKIATIALGAFSPMAIAAFGGVDAVDRNLIRMAQSFDAPTSAIVRRIILPGAMPAVFSGARISAAVAIVLLVSAEMLGAQHGVGAMILSAGNLMRTDVLMAGVVLLAALGVAVSTAIAAAETWLLRWR